MKRFLLIVLTALMAVMLAACGKSEEAKAVDGMIAALGPMDETSGAALQEAEAAYDALSDKDRAALEHYSALTEARSSYDQIMASQVIADIDRIGLVTENSLNSIRSARQAYDDLTDAERELVSNYTVLTAAEEEFTAIHVRPVEELIDQLDAFDLSGEDIPDGAVEAIEAAGKAFQELDEAFQGQIKNREELMAAQKALADSRVRKLIRYIDENLHEVNWDSGVALIAATTAYDMLSEEDRSRITNYSVLEAAKIRYEELKAMPPIELISYRLGKNIIGNPEFYLKARNVSDSIIKEFSVSIFAYDADGVPVSVYFGDYTQGLRYSNAVKAGEETSSSACWTLYGTYSEMK